MHACAQGNQPHLSEKCGLLSAFSRARCTHTRRAKVTPHHTNPSRIRVELKRKDVLICSRPKLIDD